MDNQNTADVIQSRRESHKVETGLYATSWFWRMFPSGMRRRWWLFRVFDLIVRCLPVLQKRKRLLVIRMDGIGDMVLFRSALDQYADVFGFSV